MSLTHKTPVTEIVIGYLKPNADLSIVQRAEQILSQQPGFLKARYSQPIEYLDRLVMFLDWESYEDHLTFTKNSDVYQPFLAYFGQLVAIKDGKPRFHIHHVSFEPTPPTVVDNGIGARSKVAEVLLAYFSTEGDSKSIVPQTKQYVLAVIHKILALLKSDAEGFTSESALGWAQEITTYEGKLAHLLVFIFGWNDTEAYLEFRKTESFKQQMALVSEFPVLLGTETYHVSNQTNA